MPCRLRLICLGFFAVAVTGCESTNWNWLKRDPVRDTASKGGGATPTVKSLVDYLNDNASRVQSLRYDEIAVDATLDNQPVGLRARIYAEKPRNFRMKVTFAGRDEV